MSVALKQDRAMQWAWGQLEARGERVKAVKIAPDGTVMLLTAGQDESLPDADEGDWVSLAGEKALPRA